MKTLERICTKNTAPKNYVFRLDVKGIDLHQAFDAFRKYPFTIEESIVKAVVIKGEGALNDILNYLENAIDVLKNTNTNCEIERVRVRSVDGSYYICVLEDGRVIIDVA